MWQLADARATRARARDEIVRLVHRGLTVADYWRALDDALSTAAPSEGSCLMTMDPATMLPTAEFVENGLTADAIGRLVEIELREPDFNKWTGLARTRRSAASLSAATAGDLDRSRRQREVRRPGGYSDELRVLFSGSTGAWGNLTIFRETGSRWFSSTEVRFVSEVADVIADGLRRSLLLAEAGDESDDRDDIGMFVLDGDDGVDLVNPAADQWLDDLDAGARPGTRLPLVLRAVARQARALGGDGTAKDRLRLARARVRSRSGRWAIVRGSLLGDHPGSPVALLIEAARPAELAPLLADVYGLTPQERRIAELVARGLSTKEISNQLRLSSYTVQDHLKSIFTKSCTSSRGDLVARLFLDQRRASLTIPAAVPSE